MLISIHILNLLIALIDMKEGWRRPDMANVKSLPLSPQAPAAQDCDCWTERRRAAKTSENVFN